MKHRHSALFSPIFAWWLATGGGVILFAYPIGHFGHFGPSKADPPASTVVDVDNVLPSFHPSQFHPFVMGAV
jgi:hypothetical protein